METDSRQNHNVGSARHMISPREVSISEDAYLGPPRKVTAEELAEAQARRQSMTQDEKREMSRAAWATIISGEMRFRDVNGNS